MSISELRPVTPDQRPERDTRHTDSLRGRFPLSHLRTQHSTPSDEPTCTPDELIARWAQDVSELVYSWRGTQRDLLHVVGHLNARFISSMVEHLDGNSSRALTKALFSAAREEFDRYVEQTADQVEQYDQAVQRDIEGYVREVGERIGKLRSLRETDNEIAEQEAHYQAQLPRMIDAITQQVRESTPARKYDHEKVQCRVEQALHDIRTQAEVIGENAGIQLDSVARELCSAVPRSRKNRDRIFTALAPYPREDQELILKHYEQRYGTTLLGDLDEAYNNRLVRLKNFLRFEPLREALADKYGIAVGLIDVWRPLIPNVRELRSYRRQLGDFLQSVKDRIHVARTSDNPELARIQDLLAGDKIGVATETIFLAICRDKKPVEILSEVLRDLNHDETEAMLEDFQDRHAGRFGVSSLRETIDQQFEGDQRAFLLALLENKDAQGMAIFFHDTLNGKRSEKISLLQELSLLPPDEMRMVADEYRELYGTTSFREDFAPHFQRGFIRKEEDTALLDWATHLFEGDRLCAAAARLHAATYDNSGEWPGVVFHKMSTERDHEVIACHDRTYNADFWKTFEKKRGAERTQIMRSFIEHGDLSRAEIARHCMIGVGVSYTGLVRVFSDLTPEEQAEIAQEYSETFSRLDLRPKSVLRAFHEARAHSRAESDQPNQPSFWKRMKDALTLPRDLDQDLESELCGHKRFDVMMLRRGTTSDPHELFARLSERYQHETREDTTCLRDPLAQTEAERRGPAWLKRRLHKPKPDVEVMKRDLKAAHEYYHEKILQGEGSAREFEILVQRAHAGLDVYREHQKKRATLYANLGAAGTITAALGTFALAGLSAYPVVAPSVAICSYLTRRHMKTRFLNANYGWRERTFDKFLATVDGAAIYIGSGALRAAQGVRWGGALRTLGPNVLAKGGSKFVFTRSMQKLGQGTLASAMLDERVSEHLSHGVLPDEEDRELRMEESIRAQVRSHKRQRRLINTIPDVRSVFRRIVREMEPDPA